MPCIALAMTNTVLRKIHLYRIFVIILILNSVLLFTREIIADSQPLESTGSMTRVAGELYYIFQTSSFLAISIILGVYIKKSQHKNFFVRTKSMNLCIAFVPLAIFLFFIIIVMAAGLEYNAVGLAPFLALLYIGAIVHNLNPAKQPDYMAFIPFSQKNRILMRTIGNLAHTGDNIDHKSLEEQLIEY